MEKYIVENGITYELKGEQYYPVFKQPEQTDFHIGKYGMLHLEYLKYYRRGRYTTLLTEGQLNEYLHDIDEQARKMQNALIAQVAERQGITEQLKAENQLAWIGAMNCIQTSVDEIINETLIYHA